MRLSLIPAAAVMMMMMMMAAGCAPTNIAQSPCTDHPLTTADEWTCTVKGPLVDTTNTIRYTTESRNQIARVQIAVQVTRGTLRLTYYDLAGEQHVLVTPSEPAAFTMQVRLRKDDRSFSVMYEPVNGAVEGLTGTVNYSTP
jgi:hypothetical protein